MKLCVRLYALRLERVTGEIGAHRQHSTEHTQTFLVAKREPCTPLAPRNSYRRDALHQTYQSRNPATTAPFEYRMHQYLMHGRITLR